MVERHKAEPSKVMDITHPSNIQPSTTSRPVIVSNRPMIPEDPMINQAALSAIDIEKPAGAPNDAAGVPLPSAPEVGRKGKTIVPTVEAGEKNVAVTADDGKNTADEIPLVPSTDSTDASELPDEGATAKDSAPTFLTPKDNEMSEKSMPLPVSDKDSKSSFSNLSDTTELGQEDEESKAKSKDDKRQEELEELIAAGTYRVPIGQVAKRRGRVVFGIVLIVLLLFIAADLSLDMGLFTVAGVPHTNFLH